MNDFNNISSSAELTSSTSDSLDKKVYISIACLLIDNSADLYIKNDKQQTPIDLCNDSSLIKFLIKYFNDFSLR